VSVRHDLRLPPRTSSVREARQFVIRCMGRARDTVLEQVALLVSELAANAVQHAKSWFTVTVESEGVIRVEVSDDDGSNVSRQLAHPEDPSGRGLNIVATVSDAWGVEHHPDDGKTVWFEVDPSDRAP